MNEPTAVEQVEPTQPPPTPTPQPVEQVEPTQPPESGSTGKNFADMDFDKWWHEHPDGQDLWRRMEGGELSIGDAEFIFDEMGEGKTYDEARARIGHIVPRAKRFADAPKRFGESAIEGDWRPVTKEWLETQEKRAGWAGWVGAVPIGMLDILVSSVRAVTEAVPKIIAGRESLGEMLDVLSVGLPMLKGVNAMRLMSSGAVRAASSAARGTKVIVVSRRAFDEAMRHPTYGAAVREILPKLQRQGKIFGHTHSGVELVNLVVQNEEWPLELVGAFQMKGLGAVGDVASTRRFLDKGMVEGMDQFAQELTRAPKTNVGMEGEPGGTPAQGQVTGQATEGGQQGATTMGTDPLGQIMGQTEAGTGAGEGATGGTQTTATQTGSTGSAHGQIMGQAAAGGQQQTEETETETETGTGTGTGTETEGGETAKALQRNPLKMTVEEISQEIETYKQEGEESDAKSQQVLAEHWGDEGKAQAFMEWLGTDKAATPELAAEFQQMMDNPIPELKALWESSDNAVENALSLRELEHINKTVSTLAMTFDPEAHGQEFDESLAVQLIADAMLGIDVDMVKQVAQAETVADLRLIIPGESMDLADALVKSITIREGMVSLKERGYEPARIASLATGFLTKNGVSPEDASRIVGEWFTATSTEGGAEGGTQAGIEGGTEGRLTLEQAQEALPDLFTAEFVGDITRFTGHDESTQAERKYIVKQQAEISFEQNGDTRLDVLRDGEVVGQIEYEMDESGVVADRSIESIYDGEVVEMNSLEELLVFTAPNPEITLSHPEVIDRKGDGSKINDHITFNLPYSSGGVNVSVSKDSKSKYKVWVDAPGFNLRDFEYAATGQLTRPRAERAMEVALGQQEGIQTGWVRNAGRRPLLAREVPIIESEQIIIDKMPAFQTNWMARVTNIFTGNDDGMVVEVPALDPAMRIKTRSHGEDNYSVYVESDSFTSELGNYDARSRTDEKGLWDVERYAAKTPSTQAAIALTNIDAFSPTEAVQRALAELLPDDIWDNLTYDPETGTYIFDRKGVPGNQPAPLPEKISVIGSDAGYDIVADDNVVQEDYRIVTGEHDDNVFKVTMDFPNHPDIAPVETMGYMTASSESSVLTAIQRLQQKLWDEGGISTTVEPVEATSAVKASEMLDNPEPVILSTEKPYGKMLIDKGAEEQNRERFTSPKESGATIGSKLYKRIYKFAAGHAPQIYVREATEGYQDYYMVEMRFPRRNAAVTRVLKSSVTNIRKAAELGIQQIEASGHDFKPMHNPGLFFQLDNIQNAVNRRQFETTPAVERRIRGTFHNLRRGNKISLRGYTVGSLKELAILGQILRNPSMEAYRYVYLDANKKIVGTQVVSMGAPGQTPTADEAEAKGNMKRLGARYIMGLHNHPGGNTNFSNGDISSHGWMRDTFGDMYLGDVAVNSGRSSQALNMGDYVARRMNVPLTANELGWDPGLGADYYTDPKSGKNMIHPNDPMYQYELSSFGDTYLTGARPHAPIKQLEQEMWGSNFKYIKRSENELKNVLRLGKYLQTEKNWSTLIFKSYANGIRAAVDYKDLHMLSSSQLQEFIRTEAIRWGGVHVDAFVGEGDWYGNREDVENSSWGKVLNVGKPDGSIFSTSDKPVAERFGLELAWFDGLKDEKDAGLVRDLQHTEMIPMYYTDVVKGRHPRGEVLESEVDTEYGAQTNLVSDTPERKTFVKTLLQTIKSATRIDLLPAYEALFNLSTVPHTLQEDARGRAVQSFAQAVINKYIVGKKINPQTAKSPQDATDMFKELANIESRIHATSYKTHGADDVTWDTLPSRMAADSATAYAAARLAAIDKNDTVLTLDDTEGTLASMARTSGAASVTTSTTNGFVASLFQNVLTGVADKIEGIEAMNLAREWKGKRPTVILMDAQSSAIEKIDEAMKVLAPDGRLVATFNKFNIQTPLIDYLEVLGAKYTINAARDLGQNTRNTVYYTIDKSKPPTKTLIPFIQENWLNEIPDSREETATPEEYTNFFNYIDRIREQRRPPVPDQDFTGVSQEEQTFRQWISNPRTPKGLETDESAQGQFPMEKAVLPAEDAAAAGLLAKATDENMQVANTEGTMTVEDNRDGIPVQRAAARQIPEASRSDYTPILGDAPENVTYDRDVRTTDDVFDALDIDPNASDDIFFRSASGDIDSQLNQRSMHVPGDIDDALLAEFGDEAYEHIDNLSDQGKIDLLNEKLPFHLRFDPDGHIGPGIYVEGVAASVDFETTANYTAADTKVYVIRGRQIGDLGGGNDGVAVKPNEIIAEIDTETGTIKNYMYDDPPILGDEPSTASPTEPTQRPGVGRRIKEAFRPEGGLYNIVTAKATLDKMGAPGRALMASITAIRDFGEGLSGYGDTVMNDLFAEWKEYVRADAKRRGKSITENANHWNDVLVRHQEGKSKADVPPIVKKIVSEVSGFFAENIVNPMFDMNKAILNQGRLFEMPETLVDDGVLDTKYRSELEQGAPSFDKFMRQMAAQPGDGIIQGVIRNRRNGEISAVRVKGNVFIDAVTGTIQPLKDSVKYELVTPFGEVQEATPSVLDGTHPDYMTIATRNPHKKAWMDREAAKTQWNQYIGDNPKPDILGEYFNQAGITLPPGVTFRRRTKGNVQEWLVHGEGVELYRIRRIVPYKVDKKTTAESHPVYDEFKNKLIVYDASQVRDPVFINRESAANRLWEPIQSYFPHMIDWRSISVEPTDSWRYDRFLKLAKEMSEIPENKMTEEAAKIFLSRRLSLSKTRNYGNLEQDRVYHFPTYNRQYFQVWGAYLQQASHRLETIRQFGQKNDLMKAQLMQFLSDDHLGQKYMPSERAILKVRFAYGYMDFLHDESQAATPFRDKNTGKPNPIDPLDPEYDMDHMAPGDWQSLIEDGLVTANQDGTYTPTEVGVASMEVPEFLSGAILKGRNQMRVANDAIINHLGWRQQDLLDEQFSSAIHRFRTFFGLLFLDKSWTTNLAQTANPAIAYGMTNVLRSYWALSNPKTSGKQWRWSQEIGAFAIDAISEYAGSATWERRSLRQMLGATPQFQMANLRDAPVRAFFPSQEAIDDPGVRTTAWTPFYAIERLNRSVSALAAKYYAVGHLKQMIEMPERAESIRKQLVHVPHVKTLLDSKLTEAMNVQNLTPSDIETVSAIVLRDEVREKAPHLYPVYEYLAAFGKHAGADWMQHRVESIDRGRLWSTNPIVLLLSQLQSFVIAQTKMLKDVFAREFGIIHTILNKHKDVPIQGVLDAAASGALTGLKLVPRMIIIGGIYGIGTGWISSVARFRNPFEDDREWYSWWMLGVARAGMLSLLGDLVWELHKYPRSTHKRFTGPALGLTADVIQDAAQGNVNSILRSIETPGFGPNAKQIYDGLTGEEPRRARISPRTGGTRGVSQRTVPR